MKNITQFFLSLLILIFTGINAQNCKTTFQPDLPLEASSDAIIAEIDNIYSKAKNTSLAKTEPRATSVKNAIKLYENLNITVNNGTISGKEIKNFNQLSFIKTFANYLKFNPTDKAMIERAKNTIWWVYKNLCEDTLRSDKLGYAFRNFSRGAVFCIEYLDTTSKQQFLYILEKNYGKWHNFWSPTGIISTDYIYNNLDVLLLTIKCFDTDEEKYRLMKTCHRYITRFMSTHTSGTSDGLKPDGSGYHHWNNYEAYMYAYQTVVKSLTFLDGSIFQVAPSAYLTFRDAMLHKHLITNDDNVLPLSMSGRSGNWEKNSVPQKDYKSFAIVGGNILGLETADPVMAGMYNRKNGIDPEFNFSEVASFENGFYQNNYACAGIFRKDGIVVINKGMNNQLWGSEIYVKQNRYGRYNGYGALTVVYPGSITDNGFQNNNWDWNYHPGATTKILDWNELQNAWGRTDVYSKKRLCGSLQFKLQNNGYLDKVFGTYGMFAMDFQESINTGWSGSIVPETWDETFTFKKSNFFFDDIIICLATNINNTDSDSPTITTLYQNTTRPDQVVVNNKDYSKIGKTKKYSGKKDNWVLDSQGTGYYIVSGSGNLKIQRKDQKTPSQNQTDPSILNQTSEAAIGYIDHGKEPNSKGYEYLVIPNTDVKKLESISKSFKNDKKPYEVIQKNGNSHIIKHNATGIYGFALFTPTDSLPGNTYIVANDTPCLVMYQSDTSSSNAITLSLSNPDLGLKVKRDYAKSPVKKIKITLKGNWELVGSHPDITFVSTVSGNSIYEFATSQGLPIEARFEQKPLSAKIN